MAQANLASKNGIAALVKKTDFDDKLKHLNKKVTSNKTKHVLVERKLNEVFGKAELLSTKDNRFLLGRIYFTSDDGSQIMFLYQPIFNKLGLKKDKNTEYIIGWKSKGIFKSKLFVLHGAFLLNMKYFRKKIGIKFNSTPLVIKRNNYQQNRL